MGKSTLMALHILDWKRSAAGKSTHACPATISRMVKSLTHQINRSALGLLMLALAALLMAGCGWFGDEPEAAAQAAPMRTAYPTFTPTPVQAVTPVPPTQAPNVAQPAAGAGVAAAPADSVQPIAVVNAPSVNVREQPSVDSPILATVERGEEYSIVGRNGLGTWWNVCCVGNSNGWIIGEFVDAEGTLDSVAVTDGSALALDGAQASGDPQANSAGDTASADDAVSTGGSAPGATFTLVTQEQFPESNMVRVYAYVYAGSEALEGYSVRVTHDGRALPVTETSFGGQPAFTWPFQDARQRYQNLKVEFAEEPAAGSWAIELVDAQGQSAGPAAQFTLAENDPNRELYVRYERP